MTPKFAVGQKVRVVRIEDPLDDAELAYVGHVGVVESTFEATYCGPGTIYVVRFGDDHTYNFEDFELSEVSDDG